MEKLGPLITAHNLAKVLQTISSKLSPELVVLDASWHNPELTKRNALTEYTEGHIPGARFFNLNECRDKSSPYSVMLPSSEAFAEYVGNLGIDNDTHVIVYDTYNGLRIAPRTWWMFRIFGHDKVSVLEGGLTKWVLDGHKVTSEQPTVTKKKFTANFQTSLRVEFEEMHSMMKSRTTSNVIDSRPQDWFFGMDYPENEKWKSWHIPGSVNIPWTDFLAGDGELSMKSKEELLALFQQNRIDLKAPIKSTCRRGIYACTAALAAFVAGREDVPVYDGSWEEFCQRAKREDYMLDGNKDCKE